jgi:hypothetical protein
MIRKQVPFYVLSAILLSIGAANAQKVTRVRWGEYGGLQECLVGGKSCVSTSNAGPAVTEDLTIRTYANRFAGSRREQVAKCAAPKVPMAATVAIRGFG